MSKARSTKICFIVPFFKKNNIFLSQKYNYKCLLLGYHPFYITDDPEGGYEFKTAEERRKIRVFAGLSQTRQGVIVPEGTGIVLEFNE